MALYESPPAKWAWSSDEMQFWFDGRHKLAKWGVSGLDKVRSLRAADFLKLNSFYIIDPPAPPRRDNKPFWLGRLLRVDNNEEHAWVQWMEQPNDSDPITDPWEPREKIWLRSNDKTGIKTLITSLYEHVRMVYSTRARDSTRMRIANLDIHKAEYWAQRFTDKGSQPEADELPLP
jgi:hypothetical protein